MAKIYLAGKIEKNGWRHTIVSGPLDRAYLGSCGEVGEIPIEWDIWPRAIFGEHDYTGPHFISCDHGCFHGRGTHGSISYPGFDPDEESEPVDPNFPATAEIAMAAQNEFYTAKVKVSVCCMRAIHKSDIVFAWIDSEDCYGTLVELGMAKAAQKRIWIAGPKRFYELWFAYMLGHGHGSTFSFEYDNPKDALRAFLNQPEIPDFESPIEAQFWREWQRRGGKAVIDLEYQYPVLNDRYRLDFAEPVLKLAVELDGYEFHSSKAQFVRDRQRQRALECAGWRVIRFSGTEIHSDVQGCVSEVVQFWQKLKEAA